MLLAEMNPPAISLIVFACAFGGAMLGMLIRTLVPDHHLRDESKDAIKLGMAMIGTMTALLLSLLVASAKSSYDTEKNELTEMAAKIIFLDRLLTNYGSEADRARTLLRGNVAATVSAMWPRERKGAGNPVPPDSQGLIDVIESLKPADDLHRSIKDRAVNLTADLGLSRWLLFEQRGSTVSAALLVFTVGWLTVSFVSFGLFAPRNPTVIIALLVSAACVAGAVFLLLELDHPYDGWIHIPSDNMRNALTRLGG